MASPQNPAEKPSAEYQSHDGEQVVTNPVHVRALAHPFRLDLLDYLADVPQATATECAAALNASVAGCSFHLRTLAKHGYIEPAERQGREKPYKLVSRTRTQAVDRNQPGSAQAVAALASMHVARESERIQEWLQRAPAQPAENIDSAIVHSHSLYVTAEELTQLRAEVLRLTERFDARREDSSVRPEHARRARIFAVLNFDPSESA